MWSSVMETSIKVTSGAVGMLTRSDDNKLSMMTTVSAAEPKRARTRLLPTKPAPPTTKSFCPLNVSTKTLLSKMDNHCRVLTVYVKANDYAPTTHEQGGRGIHALAHRACV